MNNSKRIEFARLFLENFELGKSYLNDNAPKMLYRYCRGQKKDERGDIQDVTNMKNQKNWLSKASTFNDPYDSLITINRSDVRKFCSKTNLDEINITNKEIDFLNKKLSPFQNEYFVSSFCEKCDDMLMWSHYANYHKGFCVEYEYKELKEHYDVYPVIYDCNKFKYSALNIEDKAKLCGIIKSKQWQYEKEWRYITQVDEELSKFEGLLFPWFIPRKIYMGYCIDKNEELQNALFELAREQDIELFKMTLDFNGGLKKVNY